MGHAQITTTALYMHVQEVHAAEAAARFDPENFPGT
jgi:site-specific recombinase XerD